MAAATGYSLIGPGGLGHVGTASQPFVVTLSPNGGTARATVVTPASTVAGTFTPTTVALGVGAQQAIFVFTPSAVGTATISTTSNNSALTNPASVNYPVVAALTPQTGGGPGSDTTAVHRAADTSSPETGSAAITGDFAAQGTVSAHGNPVIEFLPGGSNAQNGALYITQTLEAASNQADWGAASYQQNAPHDVAAARDAGIVLTGTALTTGDHTYQVQAQDWVGHWTAASSPVTVTIPGGNTEGVRVTWHEAIDQYGSYPNGYAVVRDGFILATVMNTANSFDDTGDDASSTPVSIGNDTGVMLAYGQAYSHNRPVAELGATDSGIVTPTKRIIVYDSAGVAHYVAGEPV